MGHKKLNKGAVREALERVYNPNADYVLFTTFANQDAVDVLRDYACFEKNINLQFDNNLKDSYEHSIDKIAFNSVGPNNYAHYPLITTKGTRIMERDINEIFWPTVYIVNSQKEKEMKDIIDNLSGDKSFQELRALESIDYKYQFKPSSPQFYQISKLQKLHELGIAPLVRSPQELRASGTDLSKYVDFLVQMTETQVPSGPIFYSD